MASSPGEKGGPSSSSPSPSSFASSSESAVAAGGGAMAHVRRFVEQSRHVFVAGALARISAATLMSPVDTVKTRLQFQGPSVSVRRYASTMDSFRSILREEGLVGFFRGLPPRLLYITPAAAVSFVFYEQFRDLFQKHRSGKLGLDEAAPRRFYEHPLAPLVAGGCARLFGTAIRTPFDIVRQRLQVSGSLPDGAAHKNLGMLGAIRHMLFVERLRGVLTGYTITLLRDVPFAAIYFFSYELSKEAQSHWRAVHGTDRPLGVRNHLVSGAFAGAIAATLTIPMDVVKTRLQTQATLPQADRRLHGVLDAFATILREEGPRGLTKGLTTRLLYLTPAASLTFAFYEFYKTLLGPASGSGPAAHVGGAASAL